MLMSVTLFYIIDVNTTDSGGCLHASSHRDRLGCVHGGKHVLVLYEQGKIRR